MSYIRLPSTNIEPTDIVTCEVSSNCSAPDSESYIIYILPGNPGLISFYEPFVSATSLSLRRTRVVEDVSLRIFGKSLRGFELEGEAGEIGGLVGLQETIIGAEADLHTLAGYSTRVPSDRPPKAILIGHSVGAYILLELIRRHMEDQKGVGKVDIVGGILLFPTITDIAKSPAGRILTPILKLRHLATVVGILVKVLFFAMPFSLVYLLVRLIARFPPHAATAVTHFLKSRYGVRQALWLGKEEMETIKCDKWSDEVWGSGSPKDPRLVLYFGEPDILVSNEARDRLIAERGNVSEQEIPRKSRFIIDENKIPHGWCIAHSETIAEKTTLWIEDIVSHSRQSKR